MNRDINRATATINHHVPGTYTQVTVRPVCLLTTPNNRYNHGCLCQMSTGWEVDFYGDKVQSPILSCRESQSRLGKAPEQLLSDIL